MPGHHRDSPRPEGRSADRRLAAALLRNGRAFHAMAVAEEERRSGTSAYPLAIAIELGLKAYLLYRGVSDDWNRTRLRHDLTKTLRCARLAGLRDVPVGVADLAAVLSPLYASGALRAGLVQPDLPMPSNEAVAVVGRLLTMIEAAIQRRGWRWPSGRDQVRAVEQRRSEPRPHQREVLKEAILRLPPELRDVLLLHRFEDLSLEEIAARLGIERSVAEARLAGALAELSRAVDDADTRRPPERK